FDVFFGFSFSGDLIMSSATMRSYEIVYNFNNDLGGLIFFAENQKESGKKMICDEADTKGHVSYPTSVSGARACFSNVFKNPRTGERLKAGSSLLQIEHKGDLFMLLLVAGENYNSAKHERIIKAMARSLRMEGVKELPKITITKCKDNSTMQLAKGIPATWTILDRSRKVVMWQQPHLARDAEIGDAVSNYYAVILKAMKGYKDGRQLLKLSREVVVDKDVRKALATAGGWALEQKMKRVDFIPVEIEEYSDVEIDGIYTTAAIFYMDALKGASAGVSALARKINKMSLKLYWEIPVITIHAECIPQMVCKNGKWVPDYENLVYREISRTKGKLTSPNKDFMTLRQVERDLDRYFKVALEKAESAERDYKIASQRCVDARGMLYDIDFPVHIDKCPVLENAIQQLQYEILVSEEIQKVRKAEYQRWLTVLKPAEIQKHKDRIAELNADIEVMDVELVKLRRLRDGHISNGQPGPANELTLRIKFLEEDRALLVAMRRQSQDTWTELSRGKRETAMTVELQEISTQLSSLKKQKAKKKEELAICVKDYDKIR
ncbi:MAG: hypothetical protein AAF466_12310, partial [Bacteroidota bacterium]